MIGLVLAIFAAVIALVAIIQSKATNLLAWAILLLALIHILPALGV